MAFLARKDDLQETPTGAAANLEGGFRLRIDILEDWLLRVSIVPDKGMAVDRGWTIDPAGDLPWEGRERLSVEGFAAPGGRVEGNRLIGNALRVTVERTPLRLVVERATDDGWVTIAEDRPAGAYQWLPRSHLFRHWQARRPKDRHFGLGDKTGPLDRTGRRLRCLQVDSLGYDAESTDPLYKHVPFVIAETPAADGGGGEACGLLYDTLCETTFDLGAEHSNYFPHYRHVETADDTLIYHVIAGPRMRDVVPRLMRMTGLPHLPPRWSFGFAFTTMHHADDPKAQAVMTGFAERCRAEGIPISAIHSGSGYTTKEDGRRYVFTWNESKFPDRAAFFARLAELGYKTCANVKPVLLTEHPDFAQAQREGWFIRREDGSPAIEMFWGGQGASLDMTNPATIDWWKKGITDQVLGAGFSSAWNDNNEAELSDETATVVGFGRPLKGVDVRPLHALQMTRATFEATAAASPGKRPFTITRAGPIGIARYGETWTGDNRTSWHTLKWNLRQGLSMSLSGMPLIGHDIGGFDGPRPEPELLVRWVQMMALHPRCVMNSWKPQLHDPATVPFMYPQVLDCVKAALTLRYRFLPHIYDLSFRANRTGEPVIAPAFYHFSEPACFDDADCFMLGANVLVAPVVNAGDRSVTVYLPSAEAGWFDFWSGEHFVGGKTVTVDAPLERLPIFVRGGAVLPLAGQWDETAPHDAKDLAFTLYASGESSHARGDFFWDDGESIVANGAASHRIGVQAEWSGGEASVTIEPGPMAACPAISAACVDDRIRRFNWRLNA